MQNNIVLKLIIAVCLTFGHKAPQVLAQESKDITSLAYGNGQWALVMSSGTGYETQGYKLSSSFPKDKISDGWDKKQDVTLLSYCNGSWMVVMSADGDNSQTWRTDPEFPKDKIQEEWDNGKHVVALDYGGGL